MSKSLTLVAFVVALFCGCTSTLPPSNPPGSDPSNPSAPEASAPRSRESLVATTRVYLQDSVGQGAQTMDDSKMQGMKEMQGMDHSKMPGTGEQQPSNNAPGKMGSEMEMQKTSDDLKAKSDADKTAEGAGEKPQGATKSTAVIYTCPMHPQIKETKPGNCSICGMTLIKKAATAEGAKP